MLDPPCHIAGDGCALAHALVVHRLWDVRTSKCVAVTNTNSGLYVTWCPDGSSYAVMNSDNVLSVMDVRKAGKIVRSHKFPMEVLHGQAGCRLCCAPLARQRFAARRVLPLEPLLNS